MKFVWLLGVLFMIGCKPEKAAEDLSGSYTFKFTYNSYWCEDFVNGKDSFVYYGYFWFCSQPEIRVTEARMKKIGPDHYTLCLDTRVDCNDSIYRSEFHVKQDSIDFGTFCMGHPSFKIISMKGKKNGSEFTGKFVRYHSIYIKTSSMPHDYIFIGDFTLKRK